MKRLCFLITALLLTACGIVSPNPRVEVTPASSTIGTGDPQSFTASLSSGTASDFNWILPTDGSQGSLSATRGSSVVYTAPDAVGSYQLTVSPIGVEATSAIVNINVLRKLLGNPDPTVPVNGAADKQLTAGQTRRFIVEIPQQLTQPLLYLELSTPTAADADAITVVLKDANQNPIATSNSSRFFSRSASGSSNALAPQAISISTVCRGPCIIVRNPGSGRYFLELTASRDIGDFNIYAFDDPFTDTLEPNDSVCKSAADNANSSQFEGAIETLDDVDCFVSSASVTNVTLSNVNVQNPVIPLRAEIRRADNDELLRVIELTPGGVTTIGETRTFGTAVEVLVRGVDRAGPSGTSKYTLSFQQ